VPLKEGRAQLRIVASLLRASDVQSLIAATDAGYKNLMRICSDGYMDGFYQKPRIDHESLRGRSEGLICLTSNHQGEVGYYLLKGNEKKANELLTREYRKGFEIPKSFPSTATAQR